MEKRLTRKELVEHIKQTMPSDYDEYERLAFIEREVAKQIAFDEKYLWGDIGTKEKIYKLAKQEAQKPRAVVNKKLICVTMAELFGYVAKQFGYDVKYQKRAPGYDIKSGSTEIFKKVSAKKLEHVCPLVGLSNGKYIEVDIQEDLMRLQTGSKPKAFGGDRHGDKMANGVPGQVLNKETIERVFRKVYNLKANERFTDEHIMVMAAKLRCEGRSPIEMIEFFMNDPKIQKGLQNTRCIEANKLYKAILRVCYDVAIEKQFFKEENQAIIEECILSDNEGRKRYSFCIYAEDDKQKVFFIYSKKSRKMVKLTQEEIQQMTQQVMNVELRGRPTDLKKKMMSFVNSDEENDINSINGNSNVTLEDIFYDEDEEELE